MTSTTLTKAEPRLMELRRHQVYRLNRPGKGGLLGKLRRGLRARLAH